MANDERVEYENDKERNEGVEGGVDPRPDVSNQDLVTLSTSTVSHVGTRHLTSPDHDTTRTQVEGTQRVSTSAKIIVYFPPLNWCTIFKFRLFIEQYSSDTSQNTRMFCSLAVLDPRVGHTMDVLSPFISLLCHSD